MAKITLLPRKNLHDMLNYVFGGTYSCMHQVVIVSRNLVDHEYSYSGLELDQDFSGKS